MGLGWKQREWTEYINSYGGLKMAPRKGPTEIRPSLGGKSMPQGKRHAKDGQLCWKPTINYWPAATKALSLWKSRPSIARGPGPPRLWRRGPQQLQRPRDGSPHGAEAQGKPLYALCAMFHEAGGAAKGWEDFHSERSGVWHIWVS